MWSLILMAVGGILAGGALSLRQQKAHISWIIATWVLAAMALLSAYIMTLK
ncbi:MAG: hypothetical protein ACTHWW_05530 [Arthrobacter sp.]|uniref:hypothetical protein n=1 Tax=unclassified Arthrobacter TaxID=235627 RepID=UPI00265148C5|nr:hypothetical protein [Micrococcaceae bacterium]MDN5812506.1 hypothetical protein [Micrococcaceae bacterium]MDN5822746.1 hypothetical protein [Micrococcaceae bacterium]MDN5878059.1 hypothetical protein [Micrococcaceae bacterium]MDN5885978.1 hypothetical protein [Micrococcaceae bacterium]